MGGVLRKISPKVFGEEMQKKNAAEAAFLAAGWSAVGDFNRHPAFFAYYGVNQLVFDF